MTQGIQATNSAFAAILEDGRSSNFVHLMENLWTLEVYRKRKGELQIWENWDSRRRNNGSSTEISQDGSVVTWGNRDHGGDSCAVQAKLVKVMKLQATAFAFAALLKDGSVVCWGHEECGMDISAVESQLVHVQQIHANELAFAAILEDGSVVAWGGAKNGGDSSSVQEQLVNVKQIQSTALAFAALREDGSVITWGGPWFACRFCWQLFLRFFELVYFQSFSITTYNYCNL